MNLNDMTVTELRKIAAECNISGRSTMKKAELIAALRAFEAAAADELAAAETAAEDAVDARIRAEHATGDAAYIAEEIERDAEAGTYALVNEVAILRDAPGKAIVTAAFNGRTVGGSITRRGKRFVLTVGGVKLTANSFERLAKRLAMHLGFYADRIEVAKAF